MKYPTIPAFTLAASMSAATLGLPGFALADDDDEEPFDEAYLFFELNDTDGDLGIHGKIDGDEWKYLEIEDPRDRKMLNIWVRGRLRRQGLTELFFESAEPCFPEDCDEGDVGLDPEVFFKRFKEGVYDIEGYTLDGEERESEVFLSHVIPAAPDGVEVNGTEIPEDECAEGISAPITLSWDAVTEAHEELGKNPGSSLASNGIEVIYYEAVLEIDESDYKSATIVPADVTQVDLPEAITNLVGETEEGEFKIEILVRTDNGEGVPGNQSAVEGCFVLTE